MRAIFRFFASYPHWVLALAVIAAGAAYWFGYAHDRYVSRATIVLESPQVSAPEVNISSILGGSSGSKDLLLLREYLLSVDMLKRALADLDFREHYSSNGDAIARLGNPQGPIEDLHDYYRQRVHVEMDEHAGVLNIEVEAFEPAFAQRFTELLLEAGEEHMNGMGQRLAEEQLTFLEDQVEQQRDRLDQAREALLQYQNEHGLVAPTKTVESLNQVVGTLEGELARLKAKRRALSSYQSAQSSEMVRVRNEIQALEEQIAKERNRLAQAKGSALNEVAAGYESLQLQVDFAKQTYSEALSNLEQTRMQAARKLKQVSVLQSPVLPEYPTRPRASYNTSVLAIITLFVAFILNMVILIIRDHRD